MPQYRAVVRHVRYWRGAIHHWSTSYPFVGTGGSVPDATACQTLLNADNKMLYSTGSQHGGTYACSFYNVSAGGAAIAEYTAFDPTSPTSWAAGSASVWPTSASALETQAEVALLVEWPAGVSRTGKPVKYRKWWHQVPVSSGVNGGQDVVAAAVTALQAQAVVIQGCLIGTYALALGSGSRSPGTPVVSPYYGNHQMPRGRKRKVASASKQAADYQEVLQLLENQALKGADA